MILLEQEVNFQLPPMGSGQSPKKVSKAIAWRKSKRVSGGKGHTSYKVS